MAVMRGRLEETAAKAVDVFGRIAEGGCNSNPVPCLVCDVNFDGKKTKVLITVK